MSNYSTRLHEAIKAKQTPTMVGIDPRWESLPPSIISAAEQRSGTQDEIVASAFEEFGCRLIDAIAPLVPVVKPQAAFFEQWGPHACVALARVIRHARKQGLIVLLDAKRGDIGSTATAYAHGYLAGEDPDSANWAADALTVNPYLGSDTLAPFFNVAKERRAGIYVLCKTSNPGSATFQDIAGPDGNLYETVAGVIEKLSAETADSGGYGCVGAVVGATYPEQLTKLRGKMPHVPLLVPGYGSQGGAAKDIDSAFDDNGLGAVVNNSRGINFAFSKSPYDQEFGADRWEDASIAATQRMIDDLAEHTTAGALR